MIFHACGRKLAVETAAARYPRSDTANMRLCMSCPFRKLYPSILMVKATEEVASDYASTALNRPVVGGIFLQAKMGPGRVIIGGISSSDAPKMRRAPNDHVVETFSSD